MLKINKIHCGDCLTLLKKIDDESIDLVIADPPYNLGKIFGTNSKIWKDLEKWLEFSKKWILECKRVLKENGSIFIFGIHHYICYIQCFLYETDLKYRRQFIWYYENSWSKYINAPASLYEPILWFSKSNKYTYHIIREPYKSTDRIKYKITKKGHVWKPNPEGKRGGDVWNIPTLAGKRFEKEKLEHPTQKPLALCDKIVKHFSNEGDIILVPFAGVGSECLSAKQNSRNFIAIEINPKYVEIARNRLE